MEENPKRFKTSPLLIIKRRFANVPRDPNEFRGYLEVCHLEDSTGLMPPQAEHADLVERIQIRTSTTADGVVHFTGRYDRHMHPARHVPLTGHEYGMSFELKCANTGMGLAPIWGADRTKRAWQKHMEEETLSLMGSVRDAGNYTEAPLSIKTRTRQSDQCIESIELTIPIMIYEAWISLCAKDW